MIRRTCDVKVLIFVSLILFFALPIIVTFFWDADLVGQTTSQAYQDLNAEINELIPEIQARGPHSTESFEKLRDIERRAWDAYRNGRISAGEYRAIEHRTDRLIALVGNPERWHQVPSGPLPPPPAPAPPEEGEEPYIPELPTPRQEPPPPEPDSSPTTEAILKAPQKKEGVAVATTSVKVGEKERAEVEEKIEGQAVATVTVKEEEKRKERREPYPPVSLQEGLKVGALALTINGTGTTTHMACTLTNNTSDGCTVVIPTGTPIETGSKDHQPYQTGYIPPIELGPGETETVEVPAFCTDSEKEPAPKDSSVTYTLHAGPLTPEQEKITEIIVVTNTLRQLHQTCGKVAEPDDFLFAGGPPPLTVPTPEKDPYAEEDWGPAPPPEKPGPGEEKLREQWKKESDEWMKKHGPPPPPEKLKPEELAGFIRLTDIWSYRSSPLAPEPAPPEVFEVPPGTIVLPPDVILLSLSGPLEFPGTTQFTLAEVPELKTNISSRKEKGDAVFSNPAGKVEVSMAPTEDPEIVKFNITKLEARAPSFKALDKSRGDINVALNSPEKSTGTLNIKTGEVRGTVSVKAWGKKYKEPFPAAASYTGRFDIPTKKLSLNMRGISFEPVDMEEGLYQRIRPEKFWDSVQLYSIWKETNDQGKEELKKVMTEQLRADFPKERAEGLSALVAEEIVHRVDEVHDRHKKLKKEEADFSILDPTLKLRKT